MVISSIFKLARDEPTRPALSANGVDWTYAQLANGVLDAEEIIARQGPAPGARIGIAIRELGKAWMFILAAEKMGRLATCLPSNASAAQTGVKGIGLWVADRHAKQTWDGPTVWLDDDMRIGFGPSRDLSQPVPEPTHDARFVLFSSGTTGRYKPVASYGAGRDARIKLAFAEARATPGQRHYAHDFGPWTAHGYMTPVRAWTLGALVVFEQRLEPWRAILAHAPTDFFMTPGTARRFLDTLPPDFPYQDDMTVTVSGGALTPALLETLQNRLTRRIDQSYGSTETGLIARTHISTAADLINHRTITDAEVQALDGDGRPLPFGAEGILRVRKPNMAPGYFEDPAATAEYFRDGWFHPGDIGVVGSPTTFRLTGRASEVINANGDKIAPAYIEDALRKVWPCDDIAALSQARTSASDELHIFVAGARGLTAPAIHSALEGVAPAFSRVTVHNVETVPRTKTGKIQYGLLRERLKG